MGLSPITNSAAKAAKAWLEITPALSYQELEKLFNDNLQLRLICVVDLDRTLLGTITDDQFYGAIYVPTLLWSPRRNFLSKSASSDYLAHLNKLTARELMLKPSAFCLRTELCQPNFPQKDFKTNLLPVVDGLGHLVTCLSKRELLRRYYKKLN